MPSQKRKAFDGLRVLDLTWGAVGPVTVRYLADHGATVIRVESASRFDPMRALPPHQGGVFQLNSGLPSINSNANKYGLGLDLNKPGALDIVKRILVDWRPEVMAESFAPGVCARLGLDYPRVQALRPDIVYLSTCQLGQTGPYAGYRGYGNLAAAIAGYYMIVGWPDRDPTGPYGAFSDFLTPPLAVTALIAALDHRRRTKEGQHIDVSQMEASVQYLGPWAMEWGVNGRLGPRQGNRDLYLSPHGSFPCRGEDRWIVVAVVTQEEWESFCRVLGCPQWIADGRFATPKDRKANEEILEHLIARETRGLEAEALVDALQGKGVPAGVVYNCFDVHRDPQIKHSGFLEIREHPRIGKLMYQTKMFDLSKSDGGIHWDCIYVGHHNQVVLKELLGYSDEEIADLTAEGVLEFSY